MKKSCLEDHIKEIEKKTKDLEESEQQREEVEKQLKESKEKIEEKDEEVSALVSEKEQLEGEVRLFSCAFQAKAAKVAVPQKQETVHGASPKTCTFGSLFHFLPLSCVVYMRFL